jgi:hypothetical protein
MRITPHNVLTRQAEHERALNQIPALPAFRGGRRPVGATRVTAQRFAIVRGTSNMRIVKRGWGRVSTRLWLNIPDADLMTDAEIRRFKTLSGRVKRRAVGMSQGTMSYAEMRRRNHPFGHGQFAPNGRRRGGLGRLQGSRRGVSNLAIVNRHRGTFARGWDDNVDVSKNGVLIELQQNSRHAARLAMGTQKMKAHGPFTTAMAQELPVIRSEQRGTINRVRARRNALEQYRILRRTIPRAYA